MSRMGVRPNLIRCTLHSVISTLLEEEEEGGEERWVPYGLYVHSSSSDKLVHLSMSLVVRAEQNASATLDTCTVADTPNTSMKFPVGALVSSSTALS